MSSGPIRRHGLPAMVMHWFNAVCWLFLLGTGLGLIQNPALQPFGDGWPNALRSLFTGGAGLLTFHIWAGIVWAGVWLAFILSPWGLARYTLPFLRQIFSLDFARDFAWLIKKPLQMLFGYRTMARLVRPVGWDGGIPDQDFYNAGQKAAAIPLVLGGLALSVTGAVMALSKYYLGAESAIWVQWSIMFHFAAAGLTMVVLVVHIYMSSISRDERPALFSMFTGVVPAEYAEHHHRVWFERMKR